MSQRTLAKESRRRRILDAARRIVARDGSFSGLSMRKVAEAAGVSVTTLYNLFGSKEDIRLALVADLIDRVDHELERWPLDEPIERLEAAVRFGAADLASGGRVSRVALLALREAPTERDPGAPRSIEMQRLALQAAIDAGLLRGDLRADLLAAQIYAGFRLAADDWACERVDADGLRDRALYALYVCLLAAASEKLRPRLLASIQKVERRARRRSKRAA